ncbi:MAG: hypothetical protein COV36_07255 [Alphaproteobacteria bacterium CG11_big_fil_rev_8_21_14_0_20_44_7]|nr:MAG: hypothetical protein COV36_07255 [Alphaproteobacteria bacterium CG11_big_fil_rev_8_21_14_0_20_44_7]
MEDIFGYLAGALTTVCFIPQALKILIHKNVDGLSLLMYSLFSLGVSLWLVYGILLNNIPMILFNSITLLLSLLILFNIARYRKS